MSVLNSFFTKVPLWFQNRFRNLVWSISTSKKELYLTFDDGPTPEITEWVLEILDTYKAKATFFCIGENVLKYPETFQKIIKKGHSIGNHTQHHVNGWKTSASKYMIQVKETENVFSEYTFSNSNKLFRPPYGKLTFSKIKKLKSENYKIVMWSVLSLDFDTNISKDTCWKNVLENTEKGSVVVFHDSEKANQNMKYALTKTLAYFSEKGFEFKAID